MKQRVRRSQTSRRAVSPPTTEDDARRRRRTRVAAVLAAVVLLTLVGAVTAMAWRAEELRRDVQQTHQQLEQSAANSLRAIQQLDALFQVSSTDLPRGSELSPGRVALLQTWLAFDQQYLADAGTADARFERALVHRRVGQCYLWLGDTEQSVQHFHLSVTLLEELSRDHPAVTSYLDQQAESLVLLGTARRAAGNPELAAETFLRAARLMEDERLTRDPGYLPNGDLHPYMLEARLAGSLADLALQRGELDRALKLCRQVVTKLQSLTQQFPDVKRYRAALEGAQRREADIQQAMLPHATEG